LAYTGFKKDMLDLVASSSYPGPVYESGVEFVNYYLANVQEVEDRGLSLYIFSRERGRGKTTLAHSIMYRIARLFSPTNKYRRGGDFSFDFERANELVLGPKGESPGYSSTFYVLDDLGNENKTGYLKGDGISELQEVLHTRRGKPTIITSNYNPQELSNLYAGLLDSLLEISSDGVVHGSLFRQIELGGPEDLRLLNVGGWSV
jgi:DNA replication protein DnaC